MLSIYRRLLVTATAVSSKRRRSSLWVLVFILGGLLFAGVPEARAAFVTTNETGLDGVYSQPSFGANTIDIRFMPTVTFSNGDLLNITTEAGIDALFAFNDGPASNIISMYFVDTLDFCSSFNASIVGCSTLGGNDIAVESVFAASGSGTELLAHEIGHSLNLDHVTGNNLMAAAINGFTTLTEAQVAIIFGNPLNPIIQTDAFGRFVEIRPVLVTPLPPAGIMFVSAIVVLAGAYRRKKSRA